MRHPALFKSETYSFTYSDQEQVVYINHKKIETNEARSSTPFKCRVMRGIKSYAQAKAIPIASYEQAWEKLVAGNLVQSKRGRMVLTKQDSDYCWIPKDSIDLGTEENKLNDEQKTLWEEG